MYPFFSILIVIICLIVPILVSVLLIKRFGKGPRYNEDYLLDKIRELEGRIKLLEDEFFEE